MTFVKRKIQVVIALDKGTFLNTRANTLTLPDNLRVTCNITNAGGPSHGMANIEIYGMRLSLMNQLSTLGLQINMVPSNAIVITAGNEGEALGTVFVGFIQQAYAVFEGAPDVPFHIIAQTGLPWQVIPEAASSFKGAADVATIMAGFATKMNLKFENNGIDQKLYNAYFYGALKKQAQDCADAAHIEWSDTVGTLAIWPKGGSRGGVVPMVSQETGLQGYPNYTANGVVLRTLFNPSIGFGCKIKIKSPVIVDRIMPVDGLWNVHKLDHLLQANVPRGKWLSMVWAQNPRHAYPAATTPAP